MPIIDDRPIEDDKSNMKVLPHRDSVARKKALTYVCQKHSIKIGVEYNTKRLIKVGCTWNVARSRATAYA